ncbi:hypothetical protein ERHA55_50570 [Erwinia rhapontici]|nr:hypothetical protein ERHA55_50570 [Erwinia rhapontici]
MKPIRLAIVRQKYRPDGGAERFISRALEALDQQAMDLNVITRQWQGERQANWHLHLCDPVKWGRISRERGFAVAARALWQRENLILCRAMNASPAAIFIALAMAYTSAGWSYARACSPAGDRNC